VAVSTKTVKPAKRASSSPPAKRAVPARVPKAWRVALLGAAVAAREQAHAPYSRFAVGAAVLDEQGRVHTGCNVENAAYPQGWCAETSALAAMVMAGGKRVLAAAVVADSAQPCTPCGGCRQKLREFAADDCEIHMGAPAGRGLQAASSAAQAARKKTPAANPGAGVWRVTHTLGELLPASFGPDHLENS
jgi:cytidine deaminase